MKKLLILCLMMVFIASVVYADMATVKVGKGEMTIGAILQSGFNYSLADDDQEVNGSFTLNRARLLLKGTIVPDKVSFFVQTELKNEVAILDYKMILHNLIPNTAICIGRFLPNFTYYMPIHTGQLDFISYPLLLSDEGGGMGLCTPWRQEGIQTTTKVENGAGLWMFNVGVFNGSDMGGIDSNTMGDMNDAKDVLLRAELKREIPASWINVGAYAWLGNLLLSDDNDLATNMFGGFAKYDHEKFTVLAELLMKSEELGGDLDDLKAMGFYGQIKYMIDEYWGLLARFDNYDPNTDGDDDAWTWITAGVNYYFDAWNAMIYLNYIAKMEQNDWGADDTIKNDTILMQFQVCP